MVYILGEVAPGSLEQIVIMFVIIIIIGVIILIRSIIKTARGASDSVKLIKDKNVSSKDKVLSLMFGRRRSLLDRVMQAEEEKEENQNPTFDEAMEMLRKREEEMKNNNNNINN